MAEQAKRAGCHHGRLLGRGADTVQHSRQSIQAEATIRPMLAVRGTAER